MTMTLKSRGKGGAGRVWPLASTSCPLAVMDGMFSLSEYHQAFSDGLGLQPSLQNVSSAFFGETGRNVSH